MKERTRYPKQELYNCYLVTTLIFGLILPSVEAAQVQEWAWAKWAGAGIG